MSTASETRPTKTKQVEHSTEQLESRHRELTATSEILHLIATLSTDLQPVLGAIAEVRPVFAAQRTP